MIYPLRRLLARSIDDLRHLSYGRETIVEWVNTYVGTARGTAPKVLDIGCGNGDDLFNITESIKNRTLELFGVEYYASHIDIARERGIEVFQIDIERERIPVADDFFDIVIANQIIEHTKEVFWIFSEISRTLKKGGTLIVGVPNLASLHNRVLLLLGEQPSSLEILGPHVRGFTAPSFRRFIEAGGYFKLLKIRGCNFYPFPPLISRALSKLLPTLAYGLLFLVKREEKEGTFLENLESTPYETVYFKEHRG